jgi:predicted DNA-binding transcriptional regulator YafY
MSAYQRRKYIIDNLLKARNTAKHITANELALDFGVSVRTIGNDIAFLKVKYPIETKEGHGGGISLAPSYKPRKRIFTLKEIAVLCKAIEIIQRLCPSTTEDLKGMIQFYAYNTGFV